VVVFTGLGRTGEVLEFRVGERAADAEGGSGGAEDEGFRAGGGGAADDVAEGEFVGSGGEVGEDGEVDEAASRCGGDKREDGGRVGDGAEGVGDDDGVGTGAGGGDGGDRVSGGGGEGDVGAVLAPLVGVVAAGGRNGKARTAAEDGGEGCGSGGGDGGGDREDEGGGVGFGEGDDETAIDVAGPQGAADGNIAASTESDFEILIERRTGEGGPVAEVRLVTAVHAGQKVARSRSDDAAVHREDIGGAARDVARAGHRAERGAIGAHGIVALAIEKQGAIE
jgi:hypothetical protein